MVGTKHQVCKGRGNDHHSGLVSPEAKARADLHGSGQNQHRRFIGGGGGGGGWVGMTRNPSLLGCFLSGSDAQVEH